MLVDGKAVKWMWPNFTPWELRADREGATPDNFECIIERNFLDVIQRLRTEFGRPLKVSSYYRSPAYNAQVSHTGETGPHVTGRAIDFEIAGETAWFLMSLAFNHGFTGVGVNQRGPWEKRFVHLDTLPDGPGCPRPRVWSY